MNHPWCMMKSFSSVCLMYIHHSIGDTLIQRCMSTTQDIFSSFCRDRDSRRASDLHPLFRDVVKVGIHTTSSDYGNQFIDLLAMYKTRHISSCEPIQTISYSITPPSRILTKLEPAATQLTTLSFNTDLFFSTTALPTTLTVVEMDYRHIPLPTLFTTKLPPTLTSITIFHLAPFQVTQLEFGGWNARFPVLQSLKITWRYPSSSAIDNQDQQQGIIILEDNIDFNHYINTNTTLRRLHVSLCVGHPWVQSIISTKPNLELVVLRKTKAIQLKEDSLPLTLSPSIKHVVFDEGWSVDRLKNLISTIHTLKTVMFQYPCLQDEEKSNRLELDLLFYLIDNNNNNNINNNNHSKLESIIFRKTNLQLSDNNNNNQNDSGDMIKHQLQQLLNQQQQHNCNLKFIQFTTLDHKEIIIYHDIDL
ncbi:hypothetical protein DFA_09575 [Cavenderia fasciculata]|uniref:Uncharacterized protein n=1 Tax=Cavenderia fasciculata TaxID=261658 RepID=F4Q806_CACFS|nr:uncharacterized protein DFA_09575 [Cavenderia fasciculata]EGG15906.1 hypothetical protein DFA_09575 [Cavenderia fasciculata]|eukprot:XP_004352231.1 hypothetical protein DFA_09575 [Cavenderia fasciculata]